MPEGSPHSAPALPSQPCRMVASRLFVSGSLSSSRPRFSGHGLGRWMVLTRAFTGSLQRRNETIAGFLRGNRLHGGRGEGSRTTQKGIVETSPSLLLILSVATGSSGEFSFQRKVDAPVCWNIDG